MPVPHDLTRVVGLDLASLCVPRQAHMQRTPGWARVDDPIQAQGAEARERTTVRPRGAHLSGHVARAVPTTPQTGRSSVVPLGYPQLVGRPSSVEKFAASNDAPSRSNELLEAMKSAHRLRLPPPDPSADALFTSRAVRDDVGDGGGGVPHRSGCPASAPSTTTERVRGSHPLRGCGRRRKRRLPTGSSQRSTCSDGGVGRHCPAEGDELSQH